MVFVLVLNLSRPRVPLLSESASTPRATLCALVAVVAPSTSRRACAPAAVSPASTSATVRACSFYLISYLFLFRRLGPEGHPPPFHWIRPHEESAICCSSFPQWLPREHHGNFSLIPFLASSVISFCSWLEALKSFFFVF
jgi:hypothetical protein